MSKMEEILKRADHCWHNGQSDDAFNAVIEAIKLLSNAQRQVMKDLENMPSGLPIRDGG